MGWNGLKVDGHTGTQFKHRKGFIDRKKAVQLKMRTQGKVSADRPPSKEQKDRYPQWVYYALAGVTACLLAVFIYHATSQATTAIQQELVQNKDNSQEQLAMNYETLVKMGDASLEKGNFDFAIEDFKNAQQMIAEGWHANLGLLKAYTEKCIDSGQGCVLAQEQLAFCYTLPGLLEGDLMEQAARLAPVASTSLPR